MQLDCAHGQNVILLIIAGVGKRFILVDIMILSILTVSRSHIRRTHIRGLMCPVSGCQSRFGEQNYIKRHIESKHKGFDTNTPGRLQDESEINHYQHALFATVQVGKRRKEKYRFSNAVKDAICKAKTLDDLRSIPELRNNPDLDPKSWRNVKRMPPQPPGLEKNPETQRLPSWRISKATSSQNPSILTKTSTQRWSRISNPPLSMVSETQRPYSERSTSRMERTAHVLALLLHIDQIEDEIGYMEQYASDLMRMALRKLPDLVGGDKSIQSPILLDGRRHHVWLHTQPAAGAQFQANQMAVQLPSIGTTNLPPMM